MPRIKIRLCGDLKVTKWFLHNVYHVHNILTASTFTKDTFLILWDLFEF